MWSKIKLYAGLAVGGLIGILYFALGIVRDQRDKAQSERDRAERSKKATETKSDKDASIRKAGAKARQDSAQAAEVRNEQSIDERRTGRQLGDTDRLR